MAVMRNTGVVRTGVRRMQAGRIYRSNLLATLRLLRDGRARTCPEICDALGLAPPTVSRLTAAVQKAGLVDAIGLDISGRPGRPPRLWQLRPEAACTLGVWLRSSEVSGLVVDLAGDVRARLSLRLSEGWTLGDLPAAVRDLASALTGEVRADRLVSVGIAVAGLVDNDSGAILASESLGVPSPECLRYALRDEMEAALGRPVLVGHDASLGAFALHRHAVSSGELDEPDPLLYVIPDEHIVRWSSAGVVLAGQSHPGVVWSAASHSSGAAPRGDTLRSLLRVAGLSSVWLAPRRLVFGGAIPADDPTVTGALAETNAILGRVGVAPSGEPRAIAALDPLWPDTVPFGAALAALDALFEPASEDDAGLLELVDPHRWPGRATVAQSLAG